MLRSNIAFDDSQASLEQVPMGNLKLQLKISIDYDKWYIKKEKKVLMLHQGNGFYHQLQKLTGAIKIGEYMSKLMHKK